MKNIEKMALLDHAGSPYGLATYSYVFFLISCLIPPSFYKHYIGEPDLMFLDPTAILFYTLCVISFVLGMWFIGWLFPATFVKRTYTTRISALSFLLTPLVVGFLAMTFVNVYLIQHFPAILLNLLTQQGVDTKDTLIYNNDTSARIVFIPITLIGVIWWAFWRSSSLSIAGWRKRLVRCFIFLALMSVAIYFVLIVFRAILIMAVCGLAILYVLRRTIEQKASTASIFRIGIGVAVFVPLLFVLFSFLRGADNWDTQITLLLGYSAASYNRLAAIVNGNLRYPFAGRGLYLSSVIVHTHLLPLNEILNPPGFLDMWGTEFAAVSKAGLSGGLIWSGAFGYIFSDIGWFSLPFVFGYGVLYGFIWRALKRGQIIGVVLYPCFGACILLWLGPNYVLDQPTEILLFTAAILACYERIFAGHYETNHQIKVSH